jgi:FKBP-type peptidyl-prolyl cis-trans isomerase FkpA
MKIFLPLLLLLALLSSCDDRPALLSSGFKYIVHTRGKGPKGKANDLALMRIQIRNDTGVLVSRLDLSAIPDTIGYKAGKMDPIVEAMLLMQEGDSLTIHIPVLNEQSGIIEPGFEHSKMKYIDLSMRKVNTRAEIDTAIKKVKADLAMAEKKRTRQEAATAAKFAANQIAVYGMQLASGQAKNMQTTPSGIKYILHEKGAGPLLIKGDYLRIDYCGATAQDGVSFDNSFARLNDYTVAIGQGGIIPAWQEVLRLLRKGAKITFFVPAKLAHEDIITEASIPSNIDLLYYMEVNNTFKIPEPLLPMLLK